MAVFNSSASAQENQAPPRFLHPFTLGLQQRHQAAEAISAARASYPPSAAGLSESSAANRAAGRDSAGARDRKHEHTSQNEHAGSLTRVGVSFDERGDPACFARVRQREPVNASEGLSTDHICTYAPGGHFFALGGEEVPVDRDPVKRGVISEFSAESRRRLLRLVAMVNVEKIGLPSFVTLTYPQEFPATGPATKAHLHAFERAVHRRYGDVPVIWKLEFQRRGAPHYHLLVWNVMPGPNDRAWLSATWYRIVNSGDERHLRAGTQWNPCYSWRQVIAYAAKYLGKVQGIPDTFAQVGRIWGVWNKDRLEIQLVSEHIPRGSFHRVRRVLRRLLRKRYRRGSSRRWAGLTVFMEESTAVRLIAWARSTCASENGSLIENDSHFQLESDRRSAHVASGV